MNTFSFGSLTPCFCRFPFVSIFRISFLFWLVSNAFWPTLAFSLWEQNLNFPFKFFMCIFVCLLVCLCTPCLHIFTEARKRFQISWIGASSSLWATQCGYRKLNLGQTRAVHILKCIALSPAPRIEVLLFTLQGTENTNLSVVLYSY